MHGNIPLRWVPPSGFFFHWVSCFVISMWYDDDSTPLREIVSYLNIIDRNIISIIDTLCFSTFSGWKHPTSGHSVLDAHLTYMTGYVLNRIRMVTIVTDKHPNSHIPYTFPGPLYFRPVRPTSIGPHQEAVTCQQYISASIPSSRPPPTTPAACCPSLHSYWQFIQ